MKTTFFALMILGLAGSLAACQPTAGPDKISQPEAGKNTILPEPLQISQQDAGKTISLKTGDTLLIELDGNLTTGFNWISCRAGSAAAQPGGRKPGDARKQPARCTWQNCIAIQSCRPGADSLASGLQAFMGNRCGAGEKLRSDRGGKVRLR